MFELYIKKSLFNIKLLKSILKIEKIIRVFVLIETKTIITKEENYKNNMNINIIISFVIISIKIKVIQNNFLFNQTNYL